MAEEAVENASPLYDTAGRTSKQALRKRKLSDSSEVPLKQPTEAALFVDSPEEADHPGESPLISIWGEYTDPQEAAYPVTTDAKVPWSDEETLNLLDIWGKDSVQKVLKGCVKNRHIFTLISTKMTERGFVRTVEQCQTRIKRLKKCFRQCLQHNNTSGNARLECKFYEQLERILGSTAPSAALEDADSDQPQSSEEWSFLGHSGLEAVGTRSVPWTDSETLTLIDIWGEDRMQRDLKGMHRNGHIFSVISNKMAAHGFIRTADQCQTRVKRLKASFRHCYDYNLEGRERTECKFYNQLERILVNELSMSTPVAENSLDAIEMESKQEDSPENELPVNSYHEIESVTETPEERKKVPWRDEETLMLLELWGDEKVQLNLKRCPHNGHIYSEISEQLTAQGYYRTAEQCHTRIKRLKASYRQCQGSISSSGSERVDFKFYDLLEQILEGQPSTFSTTASFELAEDSNSNSLGNTGLDLEEENSHSMPQKSSRSSWSEHETLDLIAIWGEQEVLKVLGGVGQHGDVYSIISEKMRHLGHSRTSEQCRGKIKSMKRDFRQCYDNKKCGRGKVECKFYDQLERILVQDTASINEYDQRDTQEDQDIGDDGLTYAPWTEPETIALIELWVCEELQQKAKASLHSGPASEDISDKMASLGHFRTAEQCHARITQLRLAYNQCRNSLRNGEDPPVFRYYRFLDSVLGDVSLSLDTENTDYLPVEEEPDIQEQTSLVLSETSRKTPWSEPETRALLDIWGENGVQIKLRNCMKNRHVFDYISQRMESRGFIRTTDQCHTRIKRLKAGYHLEKEDFKFYEQMEEIFSRELTEEDADADVSEVEAPPSVSESPHESDLNNAGQRINDGSKYPWGDNETQALLDLWGSEGVQETLRGCSKNKHIFNQISQEMCGMGYMRTAEQCLSRVKRLKAQYRHCSESKRSGVEKVEWKFYNQFQQIFGEKNSITADDSNSATTGRERTGRRSR